MERFFIEVIFLQMIFFCAPLKIKYHFYVYSTFKFIIREVVSLIFFRSSIPSSHRGTWGGGVKGRTPLSPIIISENILIICPKILKTHYYII